VALLLFARRAGRIDGDDLQPGIIQCFNNSLPKQFRFFDADFTISPAFKSVTNCGCNIFASTR